jgi:hypothetical protein
VRVEGPCTPVEREVAAVEDIAVVVNTAVAAVIAEDIVVAAVIAVDTAVDIGVGHRVEGTEFVGGRVVDIVVLDTVGRQWAYHWRRVRRRT